METKTVYEEVWLLQDRLAELKAQQDILEKMIKKVKTIKNNYPNVFFTPIDDGSVLKIDLEIVKNAIDEVNRELFSCGYFAQIEDEPRLKICPKCEELGEEGLHGNIDSDFCSLHSKERTYSQ